MVGCNLVNEEAMFKQWLTCDNLLGFYVYTYVYNICIAQSSIPYVSVHLTWNNSELSPSNQIKFSDIKFNRIRPVRHHQFG